MASDKCIDLLFKLSGRAYENRFIHWQDPSPKAVGQVTVSSEWEAAGDWEFSAVQVKT